MATNVYIDGFNLYYSALKNTPYKWLDLSKLCQLLLPKDHIHVIKYYTAHVRPRPDDPDQHIRQQVYLRALRTIPNLEIVRGNFRSDVVSMRLASPPASGSAYVRVVRTEEKGSDVNIAAHLIHDGHKGEYDTAVLITNDSDLVEPVRILRHELGLTVGILNPEKRRNKWSRQLQAHASFVKPIRPNVLRSSQFPDTMQDSKGGFYKPKVW